MHRYLFIRATCCGQSSDTRISNILLCTGSRAAGGKATMSGVATVSGVATMSVVATVSGVATVSSVANRLNHCVIL